MKNSLLASWVGLAGLGIASFPAYGISEVDYRAHFDAEVMTFFNSSGQSGEFIGQAGVPIRYRAIEVPSEKGAVVYSQGFGESYLMDAELQYDLVRAGYSVYELDHRGQGLSGRLIADPMPGYIDHFDYFAADLKAFVDTVVNAKVHAHRFLLTNSMGGPIGAIYLGQNPGIFEAAALVVPMMEVDVGERSEDAALKIIADKIARGQGAEYSWDEAAYDPKGHHDPKSTNGMDERDCAIEDIVLAHPQIALGGASWQWMRESVLGGRKARTQSARAIQIPVLMLQGGKDTTVKPGGQETFCANAPHCRKLVIAESTHGMIVEQDASRDQAFRAILGFFADPKSGLRSLE